MGVLEYVGQGILRIVFGVLGIILLFSGLLGWVQGSTGAGWFLIILGIISLLVASYFKKEMTRG